MRHPLGARIAPVLALALAAAASACSADLLNSVHQPNTDLIGSYEFVSATMGQASFAAPSAGTGTLTIAPNSYTAVIQKADGTTLHDHGTYTMSAPGTFSLTSAEHQLAAGGTLTLDNGTLTIQVTTPGMQLTSTWAQRGNAGQ